MGRLDSGLNLVDFTEYDDHELVGDKVSALTSYIIMSHAFLTVLARLNQYCTELATGKFYLSGVYYSAE